MLLLAIQLIILLGTMFVKVVIEGDASYRSINLASEDYCHNCRRSYNNLVSALDKDVLADHMEREWGRT